MFFNRVDHRPISIEFLFVDLSIDDNDTNRRQLIDSNELFSFDLYKSEDLLSDSFTNLPFRNWRFNFVFDQNARRSLVRFQINRRWVRLSFHRVSNVHLNRSVCLIKRNSLSFFLVAIQSNVSSTNLDKDLKKFTTQRERGRVSLARQCWFSLLYEHCLISDQPSREEKTVGLCENELSGSDCMIRFHEAQQWNSPY